MPAQTHKATGKPLLALLTAILVATLFMASCGTNTDGDLNAYCSFGRYTSERNFVLR